MDIYMSNNCIYENIIDCMVLLNTIQLYHWTTSKYSLHKNTDDFMKEFREKLDTLTEVSIGSNEITKNGLKKYCRETNKYHNLYKLENIIELCKNVVNKMKKIETDKSDIISIRDELIGILNKFIYLCTFN